MADPLEGATPTDPLAGAEQVPLWEKALAFVHPEVVSWLESKPNGQSVLDPTTNKDKLLSWLKQNATPSGITGEAPASGVAGTVKQAGRAYLKLLKDEATSPLRLLSGAAQGAVNAIGGIGAAAVDKGNGLAEMLPGGPSPQEVQQMYNSGAVLSPRDVTDATAKLADMLKFSKDEGSSLNEPQTILGKVNDITGTLGMYALAPEAGADALGVPAGLARRAAVMGGLGAQGYGTGYQQASQAGFQNPGQIAKASGLTNALMGGMGYTSAFEPQAAKLATLLGAGKAAPAVGAAAVTVPEAALMTAMQDKINQNYDPNQSGFSGSDFLQNLALMGGMKIAGKANYAQQAQRFHPSYDFPDSRPTPTPLNGVQAPFDLENQMMNLRSQHLADQGVVNNLNTLFKGISPEARTELSHYYSDLEAGLQPTPLSPEARAVANNPAWQKAMGTMTSRYNNVLALSGEEGQADASHIPRVVVESPDTTTQGTARGGGQLSKSDASLKSRSMMAFVDPDGNPIVGAKSGKFNFVGPNGENIQPVTLDDALAKVKQVRDSFNQQLADLGLSKANDYFKSISDEVQKRVDTVSDLQKQIADIPQDIETGMPHDSREAARFQRLTQKLSYAQEEANQAMSALVGKAMLPPEQVGAIMLSNDPKAQAIANVIDSAQNKINDAYGRYGNQDGNLYKMNGQLLTKRQASIREVEAQTPVRYRKDAIADLTQGVVGMGRVQRNMDFINEALASHLVSPAGQPVPDGYVALSPQAQNSFPAFRDAAMEPGLAQAFEAAAQRDLPPAQPSGFVDKAIGGLGNLTRSAINLGFGINPFAHSGFNMPAHALDAAIKFGGLKDPGVAVNAFSRASDAVNALKNGIATQDLVRYLNNGGTLMSGAKLVQEPYKASAGAAEPSINEKARLAVPSPYDPINQQGMKGMTDLSSHLTWTPDDTARMGLAFMLEDSKGMPLADAIQQANKQYPDYRNYMNRLSNMPETNQLLYKFNKFSGTNFANYEMKAAGILGRNFLDLVNPNILQEGGTRGQAAASLATKGATYATIGSMMGALIQSLTHDPRAEFAGAGSGHLIHQAMQDYTRAGGGPMGALQTIPTLAAQRVIPGAALNLLLNQMGHGYQGRQPANPTDAQDAWLNLKSMIDPAIHGELDQAKTAMDNGAWDSAKAHMANFLGDYAKSMTNATLYNGGDMASIMQPKTDATSVLSRMFLRGTRGGTDAEQTADLLSSMRSQRFPPNANQVGKANDKLAYAVALKQGDWDSAEQIANKGNLSDKDLSKLQSRYGGNRIQSLVAQVGSLPFADAVRVFANGTPEEKDALWPVVQAKRSNAYDRSGPTDAWRESSRLLDLAAASIQGSPLQSQEPLSDAEPVAAPAAGK